MQTTTNYGFKKRELADSPPDITATNPNWDDADALIKALYDGKEALIKNAVAKTTLVDADTLPLSDSAATNATKKITWANLKAAFATYYNSLAATLTNKTLTNPTINAGGGTIVLPQSTTPAQTAEGSIVWNSDGELLTVGTGTARKTMVDADALTAALALKLGATAKAADSELFDGKNSTEFATFKIGSSTFTDNDTAQTFTDAFCTASSLVTVAITSATLPQGTWKVESGTGSFTITSTVAETNDITFDYYIQKKVE